MCQKGFLEFCLAVNPSYVATRFHTYIAGQLQDLYEKVRDGKDENYLLEVQPQIGKSTLASELFPAWVLGKEKWPVIVASYGASLAEQKSSNCRDIINSQVYQMIFPKTKIQQETSAKDYWKTTIGGSYRAVGVGGGLTGMSGKILIADDLFKDFADAASETIRDSTWKWWQTVFMSRKQSKSGVLLVNTRWHLQDIAGKVLEKERQDVEAGFAAHEYEQWKRLRFPAFAEEDEYFDGVLFRKAGEVLCPERFTYDDMVKRRNNTEVYEWSALYMQTPVLAENAKFKAHWFKYFDDSDIKGKQLMTLTFIDLAISQKAQADNVVIRTVGKERASGCVYLLEETAGHLDPLQTIDAMFLHFKNWRSRFWVESVGYQAALQYFVIEEQRRRQEYFEVNEIKQSKVKSKEARIEGLIPLYKAGVIFHRQSDKELESELLQFPQGRHDDRADALSFMLQVMENTAVVETPEQKKQRDEEEAESFDPNRPFNRI
jgi:predicted phage terminase large subunit-like protein